MEKKFEIAIILFGISALFLFLSTLLFYLSFNKSLDFLKTVISCEQVIEDRQQYEMEKNKYSL